MLTLSRRKILFKIIFSYLLAMSLMVGIIFFSLTRLNEIKVTLDYLINRLAVTRTLSQSITAKIRKVRFYTERYQRFYNQEDLDLFHEKLHDLKKELEEISSQFSSVDRLQKILHIEKETAHYEEQFDDIVQLIMSQQSLLSTTFIKQELLIENQLSAIRINVGIVQDPNIFFSFGNARKSFQLMRLYQSKYLSEENERYYVMFKSNYQYATNAFSALDTALQNVTDNSRLSQNAVNAKKELKIYYDTFLKIHDASLKLKKASRNLDDHQREVTKTAAEINSEIEEEYHIKNSVMQSLLLRTQVELMVAVSIAILLSFGFIYIVSSKITTPIFNRMRKEAEELKVARDRAEIASKVKSEFVTNMSHELRTPLNAIIGFSELLSFMSLNSKQKKFVDTIQIAGKNLLMLINDILDLSKIEAGKFELHPTPVNLKDIVADIEQIFALTISEKLLNFSYHHGDDLPDFVYLDEIRIRQILLNLIGNAIKFTDEGQVKVKSQVVLQQNDTIDLQLSVIDTGIGISKEEQKKIFKSFEQQSNQDAVKYGGTGLGLSITKQLVKLMGGEISVTSTPGMGSRFDIDFHGVKIASPSAQSELLLTSDVQNITFIPRKVLVADDVASNRVLIQEALSDRNLEVITASNGKEAMDLACEYIPSLIILDIRMPLLGGIEAAERLKKRAATAHIPIIALTASSSAQQRSLLFKQGFDGFISKPIDFSKMIKELSKFLEPMVTVKEIVNNSSLPSEISIDTLSHPVELMNILNLQIQPLLHSLHTAFVVSDFNHLGEILENMGREHGIEQFLRYAANIQDLIDSFDINGINDCVKEISATIEAIITKLETVHG